MSGKPAGGRSIQEVINWLQDPEFCADTQRVLDAVAALRALGLSVDEGRQRSVKLVQPFLLRWKIVPPPTKELLDLDPQRRFVDAIVSGHWGVVPVFPCTTDQEIKRSVKKIRAVIPKQHNDALIARTAQLADWLEECGFSRPAIARAVYGRQRGLRRPTKALAIARSSWDRDQELREEYRKRGIPKNQLDQHVYKRLRGSEAPASAAVRMAEQRYERRLKRLEKDIVAPLQPEPLGHALTWLLREIDGEDAAVRGHAVAAMIALASSCKRATTGEHIDAMSDRGLHPSIASGRWGIVRVFPWTTDTEIRSDVRKIRTAIRRPHQEGDGLDLSAATPIQSEPLSGALTTLWKATADRDGAAVRRYARQAIAACVGTGAP